MYVLAINHKWAGWKWLLCLTICACPMPLLPNQTSGDPEAAFYLKLTTSLKVFTSLNGKRRFSLKEMSKWEKYPLNLPVLDYFYCSPPQHMHIIHHTVTWEGQINKPFSNSQAVFILSLKPWVFFTAMCYCFLKNKPLNLNAVRSSQACMHVLRLHEWLLCRGF